MPFAMSCNQCGASIPLVEDQVGMIINCPSCGQVIFVQAPSEPAGGLAAAPPSEPAIPLASAPEPAIPDFFQSPQPPSQPSAAPAQAFDFNFAEPVSASADEIDIFGTPRGESTPIAPAEGTPELLFAPLGDDSIQEPPVASSLSAPASPPSADSAESSSGFPWEAAPPLAPADATPTAASDAASGPVGPDFLWTSATSGAPAAIQTNQLPTASPTSPPASAFVAPVAAPSTPASVPPPSAPQQFFTPPVAPPAEAPAPPVALPSAPALVVSAVPEFFLSSAPAAGTESFTARSTSSASPKPAKGGSRIAIGIGAYISGVLMGLIVGKVISAGGSPASSGPTGLEMICDDGQHKHKWPSPKSAVPSSQIKRIGETMKFGALEVTAKAIERSKVIKVHAGTKNKEPSDADCLVLRLSIRNTSKDREFAPLDPVFVRPLGKNDHPGYSFIEVKDGEPIQMFELSIFSEFDLEGQPFDEIKPGEEIEAIVAAADGSADEARGKMLWRVRLRAGEYKGRSYSTVVGFEFSADQIQAKG